MFAHPEFLAFAPFAVVVAGWFLRRRRPALRYSDLQLVAGLPHGRAVRARWGGAMLRGMAVLTLVVAAAGPRSPDLTTRLPAEGIAIVLALDVSGSMATPDFAADPKIPGVSRLDAAQRAFREFVQKRPNDQIGLVTFAATPQPTCPLTLNHSVLLKILDEQKPREGLDAGTNIGDAIGESLIRLEAAGSRRKVLVLLSDGEHNVAFDRPDGPLKPRQSAQLAANLQVPIYTIDCGGAPAADAAPEDAKQRADGRRVLSSIAEMTGARSFAANNGNELEAVFQEIDGLEREPIATFRYRRYHEYGWCFAVAGLACVAVVQFLERTRWRTIPG